VNTVPHTLHLPQARSAQNKVLHLTRPRDLIPNASCLSL
jgi:hypothetical protein